MSYTALSPVSAAVYAALNVSAVTSLLGGGISDDRPQTSAYPCIWFEAAEAEQLGGFGTRPGLGMLPEIDLRVHVLSTYQGLKQAQTIMEQAINALKTAPAVTGYDSWAIFHDRTIPLQDELEAGVKVKELVAFFRLYVEEP